jgi:hypothetical protein
MVDRHSRDRLAEIVRHLVTGQISTDQFTAEGGALADRSPDSGVEAVYAAADVLRADVSLVWSIRLRGRFRLAPDIRRRMAIAALFLYSEAEYEWPPAAPPRGACLDSLLALICVACIFAGVLLLAATVVSAWYAAAAVRCFAAAVLLYQLSQKLATRFHLEWERAQAEVGDYDVWPFLRRADFDAARQHPRLLCGAAAPGPD